MKSFIKLIVAINLAVVISACQPAAPAKVNPVSPVLYATLYQQRAAEYKALCYQAYNFASIQLDSKLASSPGKPLAVVVDIDETVLDNSPYQAQGILENFGYPVKWADWVNAAKAETVPAALAFLQYAGSKGVEVFYITNRKEMFRAVTLKNLTDKGFPYADDAHLLMRTESNGKESRRQLVSANFDIACLVGDNLGDFSDIFDTADANARADSTEKHRSDFGHTWIMLPNPSYGSWVDALPGYQQQMAADSLNEQLKEGLIGF